MTLDEFISSTQSDQDPPSGLGPLLTAMWYSRKGNWHRAHEICQDIASTDGSWVHAHLHREEGDLSNAAYWYSRAGKPEATNSLEEEWKTISAALLEKS